MTYAEHLPELTLAEKIDLLDGADLWHTTPIPRLAIPAVRMSDGPHGLRVQFDEADHLGVEGSEPATCFPPAVALAATWNRDLVRSVGAALASEARGAGVALILGPGLNLKRTPLCGRNFEYFSEDPLLAGELAGHLVAGIQSQGVGATLKHFAANNQEIERMSISVVADERTLRELYLSAFERAISVCEPWAVMCSYNRINGVFASEDPWLLRTVLRDEWEFTGLVVSDWGAVYRRDHALAAGLDLEMPTSSGLGAAALRAGLEAGTITEADIDISARRVLALIDRGQVEPSPPADPAAQHEVAHRAALESPVLLKNDGILPIDPARGGPVAVIGELARTPRYQGAGSSKVAATNVDVPVDELRRLLTGQREVSFAPGYRLDGRPDPVLIAEALATVEAAEVVVVFLGLPEQAESESLDRSSLELPACQVQLLSQLREVNAAIAVVLMNGAVVLTNGWSDDARAILESWLLGEAGGRALAELLVGLADPSGKLAETIPQGAAQLPTVGNYPGEFGEVHYGERLLVGYRWYDTHELAVDYPFGHGLSYTSFELTEPEFDITPSTSSGIVRVTLTNTGRRRGAEVVQLYVAPSAPTVARPVQELRAFAKAWLEPGSATRVELPIDRRCFAYWDSPSGRWAVAAGEYQLRIGTSSREIVHTQRMHLHGDWTQPPLRLDSPIERWLSHPIIGVEFRGRITGRFGRLLADPEEAALYLPIPLSRMLRFPGFSLTEAQADELLASIPAGN